MLKRRFWDVKIDVSHHDARRGGVGRGLQGEFDKDGDRRRSAPRRTDANVSDRRLETLRLERLNGIITFGHLREDELSLRPAEGFGDGPHFGHS